MKNSPAKSRIITPNIEELYCNPIIGIRVAAKQMPLTIPPNIAFSSPFAMLNAEYPKIPVNNKDIIVKNTFIFIFISIKCSVMEVVPRLSPLIFVELLPMVSILPCRVAKPKCFYLLSFA